MKSPATPSAASPPSDGRRDRNTPGPFSRPGAHRCLWQWRLPLCRHVASSSLLLLPSGIYGWEPVDAKELSVGHFEKVLAEAQDIEVLLIGTGDGMRVLPKELRAAFKEAGISIDPMSTGAAVRTYNIMLSESRAVAAALIAVEG
ncbi:hypothetical protein C241_02259 [Bradyrhizobium lupini HPC(L)]|uniref:Mth938-like domain-containing protein n=1 Tax=Bradyrhizobium lupini HPC(L) TaxID=1229491 RepID=A0ABN0HR40_RHILU|nr:hypothetical protein C241_02259 [Bradyrhizobium lupini HPC(L)]